MAELRKVLGTPALTFYGVGVILGAGIYTILGAATGLAGDAVWLAFAGAAVVALLTGLSYAELATMFPKAAAEYVYLRKAFPGRAWASAMVGYVLAAATMATAATVSLAFGGYLAALTAIPAWTGAIALVLVMTGVNVLGIHYASGVNIAFTLLEALGLLLVVGMGALQPSFGEVLAATPSWGVFAAAALVFFSYLGFEDIANLAEEAKDPARSLPRALLWAIAISTVLYVLVAVAALALLPPEELAASDAPLRDAVHAASPRVAGAVGGLALFATANTALVALVVASRILLGMSRGGDLPATLSKVLPRRGTPWVGALIACGVALALLPLREPAITGGLAAFGALLAFAAVNVAVAVLRRRRPTTKRPFRVPGAIKGVPVLPILGAVTALVLASQLGLHTLALGGAGLLAALVFHLVWRRTRTARRS